MTSQTSVKGDNINEIFESMNTNMNKEGELIGFDCVVEEGKFDIVNDVVWCKLESSIRRLSFELIEEQMADAEDDLMHI